MKPILIIVGSIFAFLVFVAILKKAIKLALALALIFGVFTIISEVVKTAPFQDIRVFIQDKVVNSQDKLEQFRDNGDLEKDQDSVEYDIIVTEPNTPSGDDKEFNLEEILKGRF